MNEKDMVLRMGEQLAEILAIMKDNDLEENMALLCTLADAVAGQVGKHGYELLEYMLPTAKKVGESNGKL